MINLNFDHLLGGWPSIYHTLTAQTGEQTLLLFKLLKNFLYLIIPGIASFAVLVSAFIWGVFWKKATDCQKIISNFHRLYCTSSRLQKIKVLFSENNLQKGQIKKIYVKMAFGGISLWSIHLFCRVLDF